MSIPSVVVLVSSLVCTTPLVGTSLRPDETTVVARALAEWKDVRARGAFASTPVPRLDFATAVEGVARAQKQADAARGKAVDLVLLGDSITANWLEPGKGSSVWPDLTNSLSVVNLGVSGEKVQNVLWRAVNGQLDGYRTRRVVILAGTNNLNRDAPDDVARGLGTLVDAVAEKQPDAEVVLVKLLPRGREPQHRARLFVGAVNAALVPLAKSRGVRLADVGSAFLDEKGRQKDGLWADDVHPSEAGYRLLLDFLLAL